MRRIKGWRKIGKNRFQHTEGSVIEIRRLHSVKNKTLGYDVVFNSYGPPQGFKGWKNIGGRRTKSVALHFAKSWMRRHPKG